MQIGKEIGEGETPLRVPVEEPIEVPDWPQVPVPVELPVQVEVQSDQRTAWPQVS